VAVLPFRVLGDPSSLGYVADGLVEAMSAKLFQLKDVRLASSTAAANFRLFATHASCKAIKEACPGARDVRSAIGG